MAIEQANHSFASIGHLADLGPAFVSELEEFFINYHSLDGEKYKVTGVEGPAGAREALRLAMKDRRRR